MAQPITIELQPGVPEGSGLLLVRRPALALARLSNAGKLLAWWDAGRNYDAAGNWTSFVGGLVMSPAAAGVFPTRNPTAGPNGKPALVLGAGSNPGVLNGPLDFSWWDHTKDWSIQTVIDPGADASNRVIVGTPHYDNPNYIAISNTYRMQMEYTLGVGGSTPATDANVVASGRYYLLTWTWSVAEKVARFRVGAGPWIKSPATGTYDDTVATARMALFGCQEQPPEQTPGSPRYRLPAKSVKASDILLYRTNLYADPAAWATAWAHWADATPAALV